MHERKIYILEYVLHNNYNIYTSLSTDVNYKYFKNNNEKYVIRNYYIYDNFNNVFSSFYKRYIIFFINNDD